MNKADLLKSIAQKGYDVGFGGKKHFATYDTIEKAPGSIGFASMAFGIVALAIDGLSTELTSAIFIILGVIGLYISFYERDKQNYVESGKALTILFNELKALYLTVKSLDEDADLSTYREALAEIDGKYYPLCISKQILFSNWFAHYKFFWEYQIGWINEQLNFRLLRDKIPLSLSIYLIVMLTCIGVGLFYGDISQFFCGSIS